MTLHHCKIVHGSGPNTSDRPRVGLAVHMMSGEARRVPERFHHDNALFEGRDGDFWRGRRLPRSWPRGPAAGPTR